MKRIVTATIAMLLLAAGATPLTAQHYVGVKGGYGAAHGRFEAAPAKSALVMGRYTGGVSWRYFSPLPVLGGVGADLEFQMRGYRHFRPDVEGDPISDTTNYTVRQRTVSSLTLPLVWQPHFYFARRHIKFSLVGGVTVSYNTGIGDTFTTSRYVYDAGTKTQTVTSATEDYHMTPARDVRWNYGWLGGASIGVLAGRWEVAVEGRYYYSMSDLLRNRSKYQFHDDVEKWRPLRSELDNIFITVGVYYRLGKGGILSPTRRRGAVPSAVSNFGNIKLNR